MKVFYLSRENFECVVYADNEKDEMSTERVIRNFRAIIKYHKMGN